MYKRLGRLGIVVAAVVVTALLVGCSGAGLSPDKVTGASVQSVAADQMTMLVLLRAWLGVLYPPLSGTGTPNTNWDFSDPNGARMFGTDTNGNPFDFFFGYDDSGYGTSFTKDGVQMRSSWTPGVGWPLVTREVRDEFPDMTIEYTAKMDFTDQALVVTTWEGMQTLADGRVLHFRWEQNTGRSLDSLRLQVPSANLDIQAEIPTVSVVNRGWIPPAASRVTGTVQTATGDLTFGLKGQEINWKELTIAGGDIAGTFTLGDNMAGSGQFTQNGAMAGALNWPDSLTGRLDLTSMSSIEVTPLAAARDLALDKWVASMAGLSPGSFQ